MKALLVAAVAVSLVVGVSARAKKITVDLHSVPEGARVLLGDARTFAGYTPLPVTYQVDGCQAAQGAEVQWASGAAATVERFALCVATGKRQMITFARPADVPGLELDTQVAYQQAMLAEMRATTNAVVYAQQEAALWANLGRRWQPVQTPRLSVLCTTRTISRGVASVWCQ